MKKHYQACKIHMEITIFCCFMICLCPGITQDTYKAAVVEYAPIREFHHLPREVVVENAKKYLELIKEASSQGVRIIVFPEAGLTTLEVNMKVPDHLESYSIKVPDVDDQQKLHPCDQVPNDTVYHKVLRDISCAAQNGSIYVVVNVLERLILENAEGSKYFSTNLVFDDEGFLKSKYRKMHLHKEKHFSKGTENFKIFRATFGESFGLLIGTDVLYKNPALDLLKGTGVRNIIYSTAWNSEVPFLNGLSVQDGYAKRNGINLLAACLSDASNNSTGSGIYLADGTISKAYMSFRDGTKLVIGDVPTGRTEMSANDSCKEYEHQNVQLEGDPYFSNADLRVATEDLQNYTVRDLDSNQNQVCDNDFCCNFTVNVLGSSINSSYTYKLIAFFGLRFFGSETVAISVCAIVACPNGTSCGLRRPDPPSLTFSSIHISAAYEAVEIYLQPVTLRHDFAPASGYEFCNSRNDTTGETEVNITTTKEQESLLVFGFFGRIYNLDNRTIGEVKYTKVARKTRNNSKDEQNSETPWIFVVPCLIASVVLISVAVAVYIYKCRRKTPSNSGCSEYTHELIALNERCSGKEM